MPIASDNTLSSILDIYTKTRGSTSSTTTSSNISKEGVDGLIQQILSSSQGLAQVSSGQKAAGLYNSSANSMLTNDLITSAAGKVGALQAGSTTRTRNGGISGSDAKTGLLLAAGKSLFGPTISGVLKKGASSLGLKTDKSAGDQIADFFGVGSAGSVDNSGTNLFGDLKPSDFSGGGEYVDVLGGFGDIGSDAATDVTTSAVADESLDILGGFFG